jgi:hypothetical protein
MSVPNENLENICFSGPPLLLNDALRMSRNSVLLTSANGMPMKMARKENVHPPAYLVDDRHIAYAISPFDK